MATANVANIGAANICKTNAKHITIGNASKIHVGYSICPVRRWLGIRHLCTREEDTVHKERLISPIDQFFINDFLGEKK